MNTLPSNFDKYKRFRDECKRVYGYDILAEKERELLNLINSEKTSVERFFDWMRYNIKVLTSSTVKLDKETYMPIGGPDLMSKKAMSLVLGQLFVAYSLAAAAVFSVYVCSKFVLGRNPASDTITRVSISLILFIALPVFRSLINDGYAEAKKYGIVPQYMAYCELFTQGAQNLGVSYIAGRELRLATFIYNMTFGAMVTKQDVKEIMENSEIEETLFQKFSRAVAKNLPGAVSLVMYSAGMPFQPSNIGKAWKNVFGDKSVTDVISENAQEFINRKTQKYIR